MKIKEIKIVNQDESTEIADIGADAINVDYNDTTVKDELDKINTVDDSLRNIQTSQANTLSNLQSQVSSLASGSPAGAYSTVAALTSADPDHSKIYVVSEDGHWYYYNNGWQDGGVYQASVDSSSVAILNSEMKSLNSINDLIDLFVNKEVYPNDPVNKWHNTTKVLSVTETQFTSENIIIGVNSPFRFRLHLWNNIEQENILFDKKFYTTMIIPKNSYFTLSITKSDNSVITKEEIFGNIFDTRFLLNKNLKLINNLLIDGNQPFLDISKFMQGNWWRSQNAWNYDSTTISSPIPTFTDKELKISCKNGYSFAVLFTQDGDVPWESSDILLDTSWQTSYTIPANSYFCLTIRKNGTKITLDECVNVFITKEVIDLTPYSTIDYSKSLIENLYNLDFKKYDFKLSTLGIVHLPYNDGTQGFDIYENYLVQFCANKTIQIIDIRTDTVVSTIYTEGHNLEHCDCVQFSNTFYNENDLFPLIYITSDSTPAKVFVFRLIDFENGQLIKTYTFPSNCGYYGGHTCDFDNNILYLIGYKKQNYRSGENGNNMIVTKWNMNNETLVSENIYSLELLDTFEIPFIYCCQGQKFFDGKIIVVSSYLPSESPSKFVVIDPIKKCIVRYYTKLQTEMLDHECEDVSFIFDNTLDKYVMVCSTKTRYYKLTD